MPTHRLLYRNARLRDCMLLGSGAGRDSEVVFLQARYVCIIKTAWKACMVRSRCDKRSRSCARARVGHVRIPAVLARQQLGGQVVRLCGYVTSSPDVNRAQPTSLFRNHRQTPVQRRTFGRPTSAQHGASHVEANVGGEYHLRADRLVWKNHSSACPDIPHLAVPERGREPSLCFKSTHNYAFNRMGLGRWHLSSLPVCGLSSFYVCRLRFRPAG